jgi:Cu(I)/Ag(I) efflux system membrane fusion protein
MRSDQVNQRGAKLAALAAGIAIALIASGAGYYFGARQAPAEHVAQGTASTVAPPSDASASAVDASGRKVLYWHDPMVPGQRFDKPGKSPFMDMDLVPVYAEAAADAGSGVAISARQQQSFGVRTAAATEGTLDTGFSAVGAVVVDERSLVAVQARSPGYVERLLVRAQYDNVSAGQPLAELYVPEWLAAQEELLALKSSAEPDVAKLADAARHRLSLLGMPDAEIARIERQGKPSPRVTMTAPQSGVVWEIGARDGMAVMPGTTLFRIAGLGSVWVIADVPEAQAALVRTGAPVVARAAAFPERAFNGTVNALLPEVNTQTRTVRARIVLANPGGALKPGMFATVAFGGARAAPVVLVPSEAVINTGKRNVVIVDAGNGRFAPVEVTVGRESGDMTEIRSGIASGQHVVVSGQFLVDSEASLKGALARIGATDDASSTAADPHAAHGGTGTGAAVATPATHKAEGVVRSVGDEVLIKHGAIPTAGMGAMTMAFKAPKGGVPKDVAPGTNVKFEFVLTPQGDMQLTSIIPVTAGAATPQKP